MNEPRGGIFEYRCESRGGGWLCYLPEDVTKVYPLWSTNGDLTVVWVRAGQCEFVRTYHDDSEFTIIGRTEQRMLGQLFVILVENRHSDCEPRDWDHQLRVEAEKLGFCHIDRLLNIANSYLDSESYQKQIDQMLAELDQA